MTVSTTTNRASYSGNGSTTAFAYGFKIFADADLTVIIRASTGVETTKTLSTHYNVSGAGSASGGNVTFTSGNIPASGETIVILRELTLTQGTDYIANDPFPAESHEDALDRLTMITQQLSEETGRSLKLSQTNTIATAEFTVGATARANKILGFDTNGDLSIFQEIGTFKGTDATTTTAAYVERDIVKSTTTAQLNNVYIALQNSPVGTALTNTSYWALLVDAVSAAASATAAAASAVTASNHKDSAATAKAAAETAETNAATTLTTFQRQYHGAASSDPTSNLDAGDLYFNTSSGNMKVHNGSAFIDVVSAVGNLANVVEDTTPQLGGNLDTNSQNILIDDAHFIADENGNEQIIFQTTSSAVNQLDVTNAATGNAPEISATGGDTNISLKLTPKGTGQVLLDGNVGIETGIIDLKNGGSQSNIKFYCESSNAHYVELKSPAHSAFSGNVTVVLPVAAGTLALTSQIPTSGISSGNVATFGSGVVDNDFLKVNGTTIEGRSTAELASDIGAATEDTIVALSIALG